VSESETNGREAVTITYKQTPIDQTSTSFPYALLQSISGAE
jgi:hypothetical protein